MEGGDLSQDSEYARQPLKLSGFFVCVTVAYDGGTQGYAFVVGGHFANIKENGPSRWGTGLRPHRACRGRPDTQFSNAPTGRQFQISRQVVP